MGPQAQPDTFHTGSMPTQSVPQRAQPRPKTPPVPLQPEPEPTQHQQQSSVAAPPASRVNAAPDGAMSGGAQHADAATSGSGHGDWESNAVGPNSTAASKQDVQQTFVVNGTHLTWETPISCLQPRYADYLSKTKWEVVEEPKVFKISNDLPLRRYQPRQLSPPRTCRRFVRPKQPPDEAPGEGCRAPADGISALLGLATSRDPSRVDSESASIRRQGLVSTGTDADADPACAIRGGSSGACSNAECDSERTLNHEHKQRPPSSSQTDGGKSDRMAPPPGLPVPAGAHPSPQTQAAAAAQAATPPPSSTSASSVSGSTAPLPHVPGGKAGSAAGAPRQGSAANQRECKQQ